MSEIKRLLDQPGGQENVAKQFGKTELASAEYKAAQYQRQAAVARHQKAVEVAVRKQRQEKSRSERNQKRSGGGQDGVSTAELQSRLKQGQKNLRAADQESARAKDRSRDRVQTR